MRQPATRRALHRGLRGRGVRFLTGAVLGSLCALAAVPAAADEEPWLVFSAGAFDIARDSPPGEIGLEYRHPIGHFGLAVAVGAAGVDDGARYVFGGLQRPWEFVPRWVVTPGLGVAFYERGNGKNLGGVVEFRSSLELARRLGRRTQVGLVVYHLSNARLHRVNPGSNSVVLTVAFSPRTRAARFPEPPASG